MRQKRKLLLVPDKGKLADPISAASPDEEARFLNLADTALNQNSKPTAVPAGRRAHKEHETLKNELLDRLEQLQREGQRDDAA